VLCVATPEGLAPGGDPGLAVLVLAVAVATAGFLVLAVERRYRPAVVALVGTATAFVGALFLAAGG
jgi:hypothetical protein